MVDSIFKFLGKLLSFFYSERSSFFIKRVLVYFRSRIVQNWFDFSGVKFSVGFGAYIKGAKFITIGNNFTARKGLRLEAITSNGGNKFQPTIIIGENVCINDYCHIGAIDKIVIGNDVVIASRVFITDHFHGNSDYHSLQVKVIDRPLYSKGPVIIGDNVWIGEGVVILPGVSIGKNSIIGANSVVTKSFPENSVIVGVPGKAITA